MIEVYLKNKTYKVKERTTLLEFSKKFKEKPIIAKVNGRLREMDYEIVRQSKIEFLNLTDVDACETYQATLRFIIAKAIYNLFPHTTLKFSYDVSRSIKAELINLKCDLNQQLIDKLEKEINKIVKKDFPIKRKLLSLEEAQLAYEKQGYHDKLAILSYRSESYVNLYECDGYYNYMYALMAPSTGYIKDYKIFLYQNGFIIQYPRNEDKGKIPKFQYEPVFSEALSNAKKWNKLINAEQIANINRYALDHKELKNFINLAEIRHSNELFKVSKDIYNKRSQIKLICVAGPSSSGKTTFSTRLKQTLITLGLKPLMISIDDYYKPNEAPLDEEGKPDYEHINALDIERFNNDLVNLIKGKEVRLPVYDFASLSVQNGKKVKIDNDSIIIIEGIHALNEKLTKKIKRQLKYKIYISPQAQLKIDNQNPISDTDLRLIRRMVRDSKYRSTNISDTIDMWKSVRRGEFKWIYAFEAEADYVFNTSLTYEFGVLKKHALPQLEAIGRDDPNFVDANKLVKFLKYFVDIPDDLVPCTSLLREFIGGSCVR